MESIAAAKRQRRVDPVVVEARKLFLREYIARVVKENMQRNSPYFNIHHTDRGLERSDLDHMRYMIDLLKGLGYKGRCYETEAGWMLRVDVVDA
jgi:hypothetical protein